MNEQYILTIVLSSISLSLNSLIIGLFIYFKAYRKVRFELISYIVVIEIVSDIVMILPHYDYKNNTTAICGVEAFLLSLFELSNVTCCCILSYSVYLTTIDVDYLEKHLNFYRICFLIITIILSVPIPIIILSTGSYGNAGGYCFLDVDINTVTNRRIIIVYYTEYILLLSVCSYLVIKVIYFFLKSKFCENENQILIEKFTVIKWYPLYYIISSIPSCIIRLYQVFNHSEIQGLITFLIIAEQTRKVVLFAIIIFSPPFSFIFSELIKNKLCSCFFSKTSKYEDIKKINEYNRKNNDYKRRKERNKNENKTNEKNLKETQENKKNKKLTNSFENKANNEMQENHLLKSNYDKYINREVIKKDINEKYKDNRHNFSNQSKEGKQLNETHRISIISKNSITKKNKLISIFDVYEQSKNIPFDKSNDKS